MCYSLQWILHCQIFPVSVKPEDRGWWDHRSHGEVGPTLSLSWLKKLFGRMFFLLCQFELELSVFQPKPPSSLIYFLSLHILLKSTKFSSKMTKKNIGFIQRLPAILIGSKNFASWKILIWRSLNISLNSPMLQKLRHPFLTLCYFQRLLGCVLEAWLRHPDFSSAFPLYQLQHKICPCPVKCPDF